MEALRSALAKFKKSSFCIFKPALPQAAQPSYYRNNKKNSKDALLLRELIKDTLLFIEVEEKKALAPGGFELGISRLRDHRYNHFANTTTLTLTVALALGVNLCLDLILSVALCHKPSMFPKAYWHA